MCKDEFEGGKVGQRPTPSIIYVIVTTRSCEILYELNPNNQMPGSTLKNSASKNGGVQNKQKICNKQYSHLFATFAAIFINSF